jgi:hypothetical protein
MGWFRLGPDIVLAHISEKSEWSDWRSRKDTIASPKWSAKLRQQRAKVTVGYLEKRGGGKDGTGSSLWRGHGGWRKRWVTITGASLEYYHSESDYMRGSEPSGHLELAGAYFYIKRVDGGNCRFDIVTSARILKLRTSWFDMWSRALEKAGCTQLDGPRSHEAHTAPSEAGVPSETLFARGKSPIFAAPPVPKDPARGSATPEVRDSDVSSSSASERASEAFFAEDCGMPDC